MSKKAEKKETPKKGRHPRRKQRRLKRHLQKPRRKKQNRQRRRKRRSLRRRRKKRKESTLVQELKAKKWSGFAQSANDVAQAISWLTMETDTRVDIADSQSTNLQRNEQTLNQPVPLLAL